MLCDGNTPLGNATDERPDDGADPPLNDFIRTSLGVAIILGRDAPPDVGRRAAGRATPPRNDDDDTVEEEAGASNDCERDLFSGRLPARPPLAAPRPSGDGGDGDGDDNEP